MKKTTIIAALIASTFGVTANAATGTATVNITGTIIPSSCTISTGSNGGTIDFGKIRSTSLYQTTNTLLHKKGSLSVECETPTTALIKVSSNGEKNRDSVSATSFKTDKDFVNYTVDIESINATGGNASNNILITKDANNENVNINDIAAGTFRTISKASFPMHGSYFTASNSSDASNIGTFTNLTANYDIGANIRSEAARAALSGGEQPFNGVVTFELEYI